MLGYITGVSWGDIEGTLSDQEDLQAALDSKGSVTSVGLSMPSIFSVSGSPVTTSGTLTATLDDQSANEVFAGPSTGAADTPAFRSLVSDDIPDLSGTYLPLSGGTLTGDLYVIGSNVGIGTTSPSELLTVFAGDNAGKDAFIRLRNNPPESGARSWNVGVPYNGDATTDGTNFDFVISDTNRAGDQFIIEWNTGKVILQNQLLLSSATGSAQAAFDGDTDTGVGRSAADTLAIYAGGTEVASWTSSAMTMTGNLLVDGDKRITLQRSSIGASSFTQDSDGVLLTSGAMNTSTKYTAALMFGSTDPQFTTENPKMLAGIVGVAQQAYSEDTASAMGIEFFTAPSNAGTSPDPISRMLLDRDGDLTMMGGQLLLSSTTGSAQSAFDGDTDTGVGRSAADTLAMYAGGNLSCTFNSSGDVDVQGTLTKSSGSFVIPHPLKRLEDSHVLVHSFVESSEARNLYDGTVTLDGGTAAVDLDKHMRAARGTFDALNKAPRSWCENKTGWSPLHSYVIDGILFIECQDETSIDQVEWLITATRRDKTIRESFLTDQNGDLIVERTRADWETRKPEPTSTHGTE